MKCLSESSMSVLRRALRLGIRIEMRDGRLRLQTGGLKVDPAMRQSLRSNKNEIAGILGDKKLAPLSPSQERLWFLEQMGVGASYKIPGLAKVTGRLNLKALQQSIECVVARHEVLRSTCPSFAGVPLQLIRPTVDVPFRKVDVCDESEAWSMVSKLIATPFDLANGPLIRVTFVEWCEDHAFLLVDMHHIVSDGWSMRVFLREMTEAYEAIASGQAYVTEPLDLQYSGFACWQKRLQSCSERHNESVDYWVTFLRGYWDLDLPTDFPRPETLTDEGEQVTDRLNTKLNREVKEFCRSRRITPLAFWLSAVYLVLRKRAGSPDLCLGVPVMGRHRPELHRLIGFFVNTLAFRMREAEHGQTVEDFVVTTGATIRDGLDHQDVPFEKVLEGLAPQRELDRSPIFQVLVNYAPESLQAIRMGECTLTPTIPESKAAKFELTFALSEMESGDLSISIEYSSRLFRRETAERLARELRQVSQAMISCPASFLRDVDVLTDNDRSGLCLWSHHPTLEATARCVTDWFQSQAHAQGDALAVIDDGREMSYADLDHSSTTLAAKLHIAGVMQDDLVAIMLPRSLDLIVAVWGVLKSRAAFLPISLDDPIKRVEHILRETETKVVVAGRDGVSAALRESLNELGIRIVFCDVQEKDPGSARVGLPNGVPKRPTNPQSLAYVMYTSGSTGEPKGVMVEHRNVCNHSSAAIEEYALSSADRVGQFSAPVFDIFVEEVFPTLRAGAALVILDELCRQDPRALAFATQQYALTVLSLPTAFFHLLASDETTLQSLSTTLRLIVVGGERLAARLAERFCKSCPDIRLVNTYGPTETTVVSTAHRVTSRDCDNVPIGRPIAGVEALVLNADKNLVPIGAVGELYIGGAGVARGYWKRPELTAERFIAHPFRPHERLYRTGDRVFWDETGALHFVGRVDHQFKLRGYRIEPGEIEAVLGQAPAVAHAAVVLQNGRDTQRLAAFLVPQKNSTVDLELVRRLVIERLPVYMAPHRLLVVDTLPTTASGKVDRKALASMDSTIDEECPTDSSNSALEERIRAVWKKVLLTDRIGCDDDFFAIGGHSLTAVQVVRRLETELELELQVADLFRHPTIRKLSGFIQVQLGPSERPRESNAAVLLKPPVSTFILPGLPGVGDYYFDLAESLPTDGPVFAISLPGYANDAPANSIEQIASAWSNLVRTRCDGNSVRFIAHSYAGTVLYEMLRSGALRGVHVDRIVLVDSSPYDPENVSENEERISAWWATPLAQLIGPSSHAVVSAALNATYRMPIQRLESEAELIIAEGSRSWLMPFAWERYFATVTVRYVQGSHLSIVKRPDCLEWTQVLNPSCETIRAAPTIGGSQTLTSHDR